MLQCNDIEVSPCSHFCCSSLRFMLDNAERLIQQLENIRPKKTRRKSWLASITHFEQLSWKAVILCFVSWLLPPAIQIEKTMRKWPLQRCYWKVLYIYFRCPVLQGVSFQSKIYSRDILEKHPLWFSLDIPSLNLSLNLFANLNNRKSIRGKEGSCELVQGPTISLTHSLQCRKIASVVVPRVVPLHCASVLWHHHPLIHWMVVGFLLFWNLFWFGLLLYDVTLLLVGCWCCPTTPSYFMPWQETFLNFYGNKMASIKAKLISWILTECVACQWDWLGLSWFM